jgi:hypothetical protein
MKHPFRHCRAQVRFTPMAGNPGRLAIRLCFQWITGHGREAHLGPVMTKSVAVLEHFLPKIGFQDSTFF